MSSRSGWLGVFVLCLPAPVCARSGPLLSRLCVSASVATLSYHALRFTFWASPIGQPLPESPSISNSGACRAASCRCQWKAAPRAALRLGYRANPAGGPASECQCVRSQRHGRIICELSPVVSVCCALARGVVDSHAVLCVACGHHTCFPPSFAICVLQAITA